MAKKRSTVQGCALTPGAIDATERTGYAGDLGIDTKLSVPGKQVPIASSGGRQAGVPTPAERQYGQAKYEVVTAEEAQKRMIERSKGTRPIIRAGLDDTAAHNKAASADSFIDDGYGIATSPDERDAFDPEPVRPTVGRIAQLTAERGDVPGTITIAPVRPDRLAAYTSQRQRITLELESGDMSINVVEVCQSRYGVTILLPSSGDGATFIPKPGSALSIRIGDNAIPCYFPGTYFVVEALGLTGLSFIKAEEQSNGKGA